MSKLTWIDSARRFVLVGRFVGVNDADQQLKQVQDWCQENNCGCRISYDMFRFKNKKEISFFLLRWN
jgi:hypothetical protein